MVLYIAVKTKVLLDMKIKRENQRDEDATSEISKPSKPTTISGGIVSFFQTKLNNEVPAKKQKLSNEKSKASNKQFTTIKQEKGY
jgi:hypothetical protein